MLKLTDVLNQKADYWELHIFPHGGGGGGRYGPFNLIAYLLHSPPDRWESV